VSHGPGDILSLIRTNGAVTRADIQDVTGLSRMTVAQRVDKLLELGLVVEQGVGNATGGRRPRYLMFNDAQAYFVAVTVETRHARAAVTDLAGRILASKSTEVTVANGPQDTLQRIESLIYDLLTQFEQSRDKKPKGSDAEPIEATDKKKHTADAPNTTETVIAGIGISVPGPVNPRTGRLTQPPLMPGWDNWPIAETISDTFHTPVLVINDADAEAVGESSPKDAGEALCYVKVSTGIGMGIVLDGAVYSGATGGAGDIGHVRIAGHDDALCQCGAYGCLAAVASGRIVARELRDLGHDASSGHDVNALLERGDPAATDAVRVAGRTIGRVLATLVCLFNPSVLVLGGDLASPALLSGVQETIYPLSLPRATQHLDIRLSTLGYDAGIVGLARLLLNQEYAAEAVNRRLDD